MDAFTVQSFTHKNGEKTQYYEGGARDGTPLIFLHGWPDIAEVWKHQLQHFSSSSSSKYRVIAPDMRGYGGSTSPPDKRAYSLEALTAELVELAAHLDVQKAVWIGHDWGAPVASSLAAHHPSLFLGLVLLSVPYYSVELGLEHLATLVNRELYPAEDYEWGQFEYMRYYELYPQESIAAFDAHVEKITKLLYLPHRPAEHGKPAATARLLRTGGWYGGKPEALPDVPLEATFLDAQHFEHLVASHKKHGFAPATSYYLNHDVNAEFATRGVENEGNLDVPVLFVDAKYDAVCSPTVTPKLGEAQQEKCKDLTVAIIEAGHWAQLEKPAEVNAALEKWLKEKIA